MEVIDHNSDADVEVSAMMHLLTSGPSESKERLYQTLEDVYHNFTSIYKVAVSLFDDLHREFPEEDKYVQLRMEAGILITFCRCSLKRIFEEDGITINVTLAELLAEIELYFVDFIQDCTQRNVYKRILFYETYHVGVRIRKTYFKPSRSYSYQLIYNSDLMMEFLDQCLEDLESLPFNNYILCIKENFTVLRNYLELAKNQIHGEGLKRLLIAVENVAFEIARDTFLRLICRSEGYIQSRILFGILKALVLQLDSSGSALPMNDELLIGYMKCVQDNVLERLKIGLPFTVREQLKNLHQGISFVTHLLVTYTLEHDSEQEKLSNIRLDFQAFARSVEYIICSCSDCPKVEEKSPVVCGLIEKIDVIKGEIIKIICCIVLERAPREYPVNDQLGSLILLLQKLKEFMDCKPDLIVTWKDHENLVLLIFYLIQNNIRGGNSTGDDEFSRNALQLDTALIDHENLSRVLISAQVVAFKMACTMLRRQGRFHWWELYLGTRDGVNSHMCVGILKALVCSLDDNSAPPLTDELLIAYVECIQDNLLELQKYTYSAPLMDQINILHTGLPFLVHLLISYADEKEKLSHVKVYFQGLLRNVGSAICSCFSDWLKGDMETVQKMDLSDLVVKLNLITSKTEGFLHLFILNKIGRESPKTDHLGSLNLLLESWKGLMECESSLIITWKDEFETIYKNFVSFKSFITTTSSGDDELQKLCSSIMDAGHVAEYLLTTFSTETCPVWGTYLWIPELVKRVEQIKSAVMEVNKQKANVKEVGTASKNTSPVSCQALLVQTLPDLVIGFDEEMKLIKEQIFSDLTQLDVISIIGMPGLGKTTLARKVYEDRFTVTHFEVRAWCRVSQECNKKELFLTILGSIIELTSTIKRKNELELSAMVHQKLMGKRYLIVLDDIWSVAEFNELCVFFPDNRYGSRIMLTSRIKVTGSEAKLHSDPIETGTLTDEECWNLLERKVYREGKCPSELRQIGNEIAKKCRGLPLVVLIVAGILVKSAETQEFWKEIEHNLSSYHDSQSHVMAVLELSYMYLPDHLKPMFLYLGAFPEDAEIHADEIMWLWMAEGFVQNTELTSLEIEAEKNLMELIDRSLVVVTKWRWDGRVKACHIHGLLRNISLAKAKEQKIIQQVQVHSELPYPKMYQRRLSILLERNDESTARHFAAYTYLQKFSIAPPIYSLLFFPVGQNKDHFPLRHNRGLVQVISSLKLLKVFVAEIFEFTQNDFDMGLIMLVHLRFVMFHTAVNYIPSSISRLRSLETLIIEGTFIGQSITVPETIWELTELRHLHINPCARFSVGRDNPSILKNLQTLSKPRVYLGEEEKLIMKVPGVKKLKWELTDGYYSGRRTHPLPNMESLDKLESLTAYFRGHTTLVGEFKLPLTLKKLSISGFSFQWSQISIFKALPNLQALKLEHKSLCDEYWCMGDDDVFANLKFLKLEDLEIKGWSASSVNFPSLEKVVLRRCRQLEEIPSDLGEFVSIKNIEVSWCGSSAVKMAKEIQDKQGEIGNETLTVYINQSQEEVNSCSHLLE